MNPEATDGGAFFADLHIHSRFSRATARTLAPETLAASAAAKGLGLVGTGDLTHPEWLRELRDKLEPWEGGFYRLRRGVLDEALRHPFDPKAAAAMARAQGDGPAGGVRGIRGLAGSGRAGEALFTPTGEISCIYKQGGRTRKIHLVVWCPTLEGAGKVGAALGALGNVISDGRPILGLSARDAAAAVLDADPEARIVPAHVWTPWFSLFGSMSGFDDPDECFGDLAGEITALETGLSSDPYMNRLVSRLDRFALVSSSDAHSPDRLGREATAVAGPPDVRALRSALAGGPELLGTVEFFPEEGKYHLDGHSACGPAMTPEETRRNKGLCPVCGKPVTVGVLNRVMELADRQAPPEGSLRPDRHILPLREILGQCLGRGPDTRSVREAEGKLILAFGSEYRVLLDASPGDLELAGGTLLRLGVERMREGRVTVSGGYDGVFGTVEAVTEDDRREHCGGGTLFSPGRRGCGPVRRDPAPAPGPAGGPSDAPAPPPPEERGLEGSPLARTAAAGRFPVAAGQFHAADGQFPFADGQFPAVAGQFHADSGQFHADSGQFQADSGQFPAAAEQFQADSGQFTAAAGQFPVASRQFQADSGQFPVASEQFQADSGQSPAASGQFSAAAGQFPAAVAGDLGWKRGQAGFSGFPGGAAGLASGLARPDPPGMSAGPGPSGSAVPAGLPGHPPGQGLSGPSGPSGLSGGCGDPGLPGHSALAALQAGAAHPDTPSLPGPSAPPEGLRRSPATGAASSPKPAHPFQPPLPLPSAAGFAGRAAAPLLPDFPAALPGLHGPAAPADGPSSASSRSGGGAGDSPAGAAAGPEAEAEGAVRRPGPQSAGNARSQREGDPLRGLNEAQLRCATFGGESLLVSAGPGSGKTRVLLARALWLMDRGFAGPGEMLLTTFTRKAAHTLAERLEDAGRGRGARPRACTLHSLAFDLLARSGEEPRLAGEDFLEEAARGAARGSHLSPQGLMGLASRLKNLGLPQEAGGAAVSAALRRYRDTLAAAGLMDFDDLMAEAARLAADGRLPGYRAVLADEAQDLSPLEYGFLKGLSGGARLTAIGDPAQCIYGFRGALPSLREALERDRPDLEILDLPLNYRCTPAISDASELFRQLDGRERRSALPIRGRRIVRAKLDSTLTEAFYIARRIKEHLGVNLPGGSASGGGDVLDGLTLGDVAVIYRLRTQGQELIKTLLEEGIPCQISGDEGEGAQDGLDLRAEKVSLLTIHAAKGLEFRLVFVVGLDEGLCPYEPASETGPPYDRAAEEERLFYVALTRARELVYLTRVRRRRVHGRILNGRPSPFWTRIPAEAAEDVDVRAVYSRRPRPLF